MAETQEGHADQSGVSESTPKLHADIGHTFLEDTNSPRGHIRELYMSGRELFTDSEKREAFTKAATITKGYNDALIERWTKEIDTYLVYAGLFSAILTAFNVESYQLLQPVPPDPSPAILQHISLQLTSLSYIPPLINSTYPAFSSSGTSTTTSSAVFTWAIWLNALWLSGLVLSLSAASVGILVKQWLNEFQSGLSGDSEHIARLRQYRLNNLQRCHVGSIVNTIPVLLQGALALFLVGLLVLLWNLHRAVAAVTSVFVLAIAVFIVGTTIAPLVTAHCAYLSPQSLVVYALWPNVPHLTRKWLSAFKVWLPEAVRRAQAFAGLPSPTANQDTSKTTSAASGPPQLSWIARERSLVNAYSEKLERDMTLSAYEATLDSDVIVSATARVVTWDAWGTLQWFARLVEIDTFHFGQLQEHERSAQHRRLHGAIFYGYILLCATLEEHPFAESATSRELIKSRFTDNLGHLLSRHIPADYASDSLRTKTVWIVATHVALALFTAKIESEYDIQITFTLAAYGTLPEHLNTILVGSSKTCAVFAFRALQASNYSLEKPYLRGHALLLRSRQRLGRSEFLEEGVKDALSDLSATLGCLSISRLDDATKHTEDVVGDITRPLSHIVHALSHNLDSFQPLLPPGFCITMETFFSKYKQSVLFERSYLVSVPWKVDLWYPSDPYDATQELIEKLRNSTSQDTRAARSSQSDSDTPSQPSVSSTPHQFEETSDPSNPNCANAITPPSTQSHPDTSGARPTERYGIVVDCADGQKLIRQLRTSS
ncbi:hypothetical protein ONZ51_g11836 [Trametes cubensis]|uniref:DUF6535 domain-containing protein n=1 Tax=Trametes cubensis TaxID=1111947 RepID=A0AAD7X3V4_9APHY|nr:hypothetical protein ONZ51_g11836 [Trametes cubensis]